MRHPPRLSALLAGAALTMASTAFAVVGTASGAAAAPACTVEYSVVGQWSGGYQGAVTITNNSAALNGWSLGFAFPAGQVVSQGWGGKWSQSGASVTVLNESWNAALATGAKVTGGFIASWTGANTAPTAFTLNGTPCNTDGPTPTPTPTPSTTTPTPTPTDPTTPPTTRPPVSVTAVSVTGLRQIGPTTAEATVEITTDGTGPVTLLVEWFTGDQQGSPGAPDGSDTLRRQGSTHYTLTLSHSVRGAGCYWGARATTNPAAASGGSLQQVFIRRCVIT
ncbi:cellulose-binding domain-containing protein [Streptomyces viridochromogenes]|uniref:cellulose-binding domain-containing protein n=1 Tax=Streptomyces viridochromogenes TaxID=1938 RepID=UPI002D21A420|nr:cellulose-binding domain-containing protein [Streptomyces viridochromogenes]